MKPALYISARRGIQFVLNADDCLLRDTSTKHNKYVVNKKCEYFSCSQFQGTV